MTTTVECTVCGEWVENPRFHNSHSLCEECYEDKALP